ncbi:PQQ-dependent sugar dehydrogenase [Croceicoccus naphthovorans]|uniref:Dehydrogenase n=1 Tax=Croceicoccus naphthovorans TaxID=1348774 RepID=A0A0G3XIL6_9SPHN|nr:PQQ-dependent sugar dehydrogenase [Croceicoccus naphthovorans]AKM10183.1 dehydrogenase [Croceicoccus naphthovorans]MBB3990579.1 glucose/arabinose dehydrogenase [Croceicoccus naphthovorans]
MHITRLLLPAFIALASCGVPSSAGGSGQAVENADQTEAGDPGTQFAVQEMARFDEPWAMAFEPGTGTLFVTEKSGALKFLTADGQRGSVSGVPIVAYGGQGGFGDIAFAPDYAASRAIYLSWAEAGRGNLRGAAVGRGTLSCESDTACTIKDLRVIWRQMPKVSGQGHYSHRLAFAPDGQYLFVASGDRQKMDPAQDPQSTLGKIVRLNLDGTPAAGNPLADENVALPEVWTMGHRNILGLAFDGQGQLWGLEHGPQGGDELNRIKPGKNYGWPVVSNGDHYGGQPIPNHAERPEFAPPAISWNPVIAPGDMLIYSGAQFPGLQGHALIAGLKTQALIDVSLDSDGPVERARYDFGRGLRALAQGPDGSIWVAENGKNARILRLTPR